MFGLVPLKAAEVKLWAEEGCWRQAGVCLWKRLLWAVTTRVRRSNHDPHSVPSLTSSVANEVFLTWPARTKYTPSRDGALQAAGLLSEHIRSRVRLLQPKLQSSAAHRGLFFCFRVWSLWRTRRQRQLDCSAGNAVTLSLERPSEQHHPLPACIPVVALL